jgi:hypothetical protein
MGEFLSKRKDSSEVLRPRYQAYFRKFVSQGGCTVGQHRTTGELVLTPVWEARNNCFHPTQAANFYKGLARFNLPSDVWTRDVAKAASLPCGTVQQLFDHGPIGEHLRWVWHREEFKVFWDSMNWPSTPRRNFDWYLTTRLGLPKGCAQFNGLKEDYVNWGPAKMGFNVVAPYINVHAYDCCAAIGAVGDDFMRAMGVLGEMPTYNNRSHQHRVFGRAPEDLGGINGHQMSQVMEVFLLGGLLAAKNNTTQKIATLQFNPKFSPFRAEGFLKLILPLLQELEKRKAHGDQAGVRQCEGKLWEVVGRKGKLPTRDDVPYEHIYQLAVKTYADRQREPPELSRQWVLTVDLRKV